MQNRESPPKNGYTKVVVIGLLVGIAVPLLLSAGILWLPDDSVNVSQADDSALRERMGYFFGRQIPDSAGTLYYYYEGFLDSHIYIGMSLEPATAWRFINEWIGKTKDDFRDDEYEYGMYFASDNESVYNDFTQMAKPMWYRIDVDEDHDGMTFNVSDTTVFYDEATRRLLIEYCTY